MYSSSVAPVDFPPRPARSGERRAGSGEDGEVRSEKREVRSQKSEVRSQKSEYRRKRARKSEKQNRLSRSLRSFAAKQELLILTPDFSLLYSLIRWRRRRREPSRGRPEGARRAARSRGMDTGLRHATVAVKIRLHEGLGAAAQDPRHTTAARRRGRPARPPRGDGAARPARRTVAAEVAGRAARPRAKLDFSVLALAAYVVAGGGRHADLDEQARVVGRHAAADQAPPGGDPPGPRASRSWASRSFWRSCSSARKRSKSSGCCSGGSSGSPLSVRSAKKRRKSATVGRRAASLFARPLFPSP